jgi:hypothetical protein
MRARLRATLLGSYKITVDSGRPDPHNMSVSRGEVTMMILMMILALAAGGFALELRFFLS